MTKQSVWVVVSSRGDGCSLEIHGIYTDRDAALAMMESHREEFVGLNCRAGEIALNEDITDVTDFLLISPDHPDGVWSTNKKDSWKAAS